MRAIVDPDVCTGCGLCVDICPEVFELSGDVAISIVDEVPQDCVETCQESAESCPVEAIRIEEN